MNARFHKKTFLESFLKKRRPKRHIRGMYLLHDNASGHKLKLWHRLWINRGQCSRTPALFSRSSPFLAFSCSLVSRKSMLAENIHPAKSWGPSFLISLEVHLKKSMRKLSKPGLKDGDVLYLSKESTWRFEINISVKPPLVVLNSMSCITFDPTFVS